ncbi:MAG: hypothetical protein IJ348_06920 [Alistipes sp.]|nr:hypothetical protein [Alistipes sp.]
MLIENPKTYKGNEVETIFFRPSFCGKSAEELGIRVLYNMPMPTTVQVWSKPDNVLQTFASGWSGGKNATKLQKTINMHKVKAETAFSADDYFSMVFEKITGSADVNMGDLTGTELEKAETELFRQAIAEGVRATMWLGDTDGVISSFKTFNGFLKAIHDAIDSEPDIIAENISSSNGAIDVMQATWNNATADLKALRSEENLVYLVSSDLYNKYIEELDAKGTDSAYRESIDGRSVLLYHGIPVVEVPLSKYVHNYGNSFCILTDRRNFVLALNTADIPENEVRMWYNPDEMENRQRAVFLAGTEILDLKLVSASISEN